jgi:hypothetical protein
MEMGTLLLCEHIYALVNLLLICEGTVVSTHFQVCFLANLLYFSDCLTVFILVISDRQLDSSIIFLARSAKSWEWSSYDRIWFPGPYKQEIIIFIYMYYISSVIFLARLLKTGRGPAMTVYGSLGPINKKS